MARAKPDAAIVHLAAVSSVVTSHAEPGLAFQVNTMGTLHLCIAEGAREEPTDPARQPRAKSTAPPRPGEREPAEADAACA